MVDSNNIFSSPTPLTLQQKEGNKVSYWLEKLFNQEKEKNKKLQDNENGKQTLKNKGKQDFVENYSKQVETNKQSLVDMVHNSNSILMSISSAALFDFFPTTINVEATRVTIITRQLFSSQVHSVDIKDISSVFIETSILFAAITLISKTFSQKELLINNLRKKEAILLRRVIEGLRMFEKKDINITNFSREELLIKLKELSETEIVL